MEALEELGLSAMAVGVILGGVGTLIVLWVLAPAVDLSRVSLFERREAQKIAAQVRREIERAARAAEDTR